MQVAAPAAKTSGRDTARDCGDPAVRVGPAPPAHGPAVFWL